MSYCRFGSNESEVYVFLSVDGHLECCGCRLGDQWSFDSTDAMLAHLDEHKAAGHTVPEYAIERLKSERDENDAFIASGAALQGTEAQGDGR